MLLRKQASFRKRFNRPEENKRIAKYEGWISLQWTKMGEGNVDDEYANEDDLEESFRSGDYMEGGMASVDEDSGPWVSCPISQRIHVTV